MKKVAVFPGSFDPVTLGHESVVKRALPLFDEIIVALGVNTRKNYMFPENKRLEWLRQTFSGLASVKVMEYSGLTVELCRQTGARYIIRGLRNAGDFETERSIAQMNKALYQDIETVFILTDPAFEFIHSTLIREIIMNKGDVSAFLPAAVKW